MIGSINSTTDLTSYISSASKKTKKKDNTDKAEISNTALAYDVVSKMFDLGQTNRITPDDINKLSPKERENALKMLGTLLKDGLVGYEILEIDGKEVKSFIVNQIGDQRTYGAKLSRRHYNR